MPSEGESSKRISHWIVAGELREKLKAELDEIQTRERAPVALIPKRLPQRFLGAFLFQNGFEQFLSHCYQNHFYLARSNADLKNYQQPYIIEFKNLKDPIITKAENRATAPAHYNYRR